MDGLCLGKWSAQTPAKVGANSLPTEFEQSLVRLWWEALPIAATGLAGDGETVSVTFTVPEQAGEYEYICSFPGHYAADMKGVLTVKSASS